MSVRRGTTWETSKERNHPDDIAVRRARVTIALMARQRLGYAALGLVIPALVAAACGQVEESPPPGTTGCTLMCDRFEKKCGYDAAECLSRCDTIVSFAKDPAECGKAYDGLIACKINENPAWPSCDSTAPADAGLGLEAAATDECGKKFDFGGACLNR